jgi:hypothetical protein
MGLLMPMFKNGCVVLMLSCTLTSTGAQEVVSLKTIHRVFIEKMPNDLDQYLSAEITKQMKGRLVVVLDKSLADALLQGTGTERTGTGAAITGRYLGLHDNATGAISLLDKAGTMVLWSDEAGDRSLMFGVMKRGGPRKVADRLVSDLKKALEKAK